MPASGMLEYGTLDAISKNRVFPVSYFIRKGSPSRPAILYMHGLGCAKDNFLNAAKVASLDAYALLAFDMPGCGGSPYPENMNLKMDNLAEIINSAIEKAGISEPFFIIGHSMGGAVGLLYTLQFPEKVRGFINVEGNMESANCTASRKAAQSDFADFNNNFLPALKTEIKKHDNPGTRNYALTLENALPKAFFDYSVSLVDYSDNAGLLSKFIGLKLPKVLIYGSENSGSLSYLEKLRAAGCETAEISGSNHSPFYDNPSGFYKAVSDFVARY
jgi:pimeloyl-ACP methyl ester carboxylesterase